jgi:hypothetical protein
MRSSRNLLWRRKVATKQSEGRGGKVWAGRMGVGAARREQVGVSAVHVRVAGSIGRGHRQYRPAAATGDLLIGGARSSNTQATVEAQLAEAGKPRWGRPGGRAPGGLRRLEEDRAASLGRSGGTPVAGGGRGVGCSEASAAVTWGARAGELGKLDGETGSPLRPPGVTGK